jgi:hypothetical protein
MSGERLSRAVKTFLRLGHAITLAVVLDGVDRTPAAGMERPSHAEAEHLEHLSVVFPFVGSSVGDKPVEPVRAEFPAVVPPAPPENVPLKRDPERLPKPARAIFPAFDGDSFFVSIPPKEAEKLPASQVFKDIVGPMLRSFGFERDFRQISPPAQEGTRMPRANLAGLAADTCRELRQTRLSRYKEQCDVMQGLAKPTPDVDRAFQTGEGMTFQQFRADVERQEIQYAFRQIVLPGNDPIEYTIILASRWEGETVSMVMGRFFNRYFVTNKVTLKPEEATERARKELLAIKGIADVQAAPKRVERVLLPYGGARDNQGVYVTAVRYAYRMPIQALFVQPVPRASAKAQPFAANEGFWYLWLDAETGRILQLQPLVADAVQAQGRAWRRAPDSLPTTDLLPFDVNDASGGQYTLQLDEAGQTVFRRVDRFGDGNFNDGEVSISSTNESTASFANFDQATAGMNDGANAVCNNDPAGNPANKTFQQIDLFATVSRHRSMGLNAGLFTPFPSSGAMKLTVEDTTYGYGCNAMGSPTYLKFGQCPGFTSAMCHPGAIGRYMNTSQDHTWVGHEFGHAMTARQYTDRPADWCMGPSFGGTPAACPVPVSPLGSVHDWADAWAHAFENINCFGGWTGHNIGGPGLNASLNCLANTSEGDGFIRLSRHSAVQPGNSGAAVQPGNFGRPFSGASRDQHWRPPRIRRHANGRRGALGSP